VASMGSVGLIRSQLLPFHTSHVHTVFVSTGCALVFDQVGQSKDWNCHRLQ